MAGFFSDLQDAMPGVTDPRRRQALAGILSQRDEMITLLSRAQPESSQRLMLLYTSMFAAVDPQGAVGQTVTPSPLPPPAPVAAPESVARPAPSRAAAPPPVKPAPARP
jgi:hypothetical protein